MIGIIDYGLGNIKAFSNIYKSFGIEHKIVKEKTDLENIEKIILPGVGAFDDAMKKFNDSGLRDIVEKLVIGEKKLPILGVCVGLQMLGNSSEEGCEKGLGWIDGEVKKIDVSTIKHHTKLPHMGWNSLQLNDKNEPLFKSINSNDRFYFLHSYYFQCKNETNILAYSKYGIKFTCSLKKNNIYGVQFHPEKSLVNGEKLLFNFSTI